MDSIMDQDIVDRLRIRASIRRQIPGRKSVQENKPDRIADLLDEAAEEIQDLRNLVQQMMGDTDG
jgi:surfactin synthase thioesterase subunit